MSLINRLQSFTQNVADFIDHSQKFCYIFKSFTNKRINIFLFFRWIRLAGEHDFAETVDAAT